jgi:hypothetical protein
LDYLKDIGEWCLAVFEHWHGWIIASVFAFILEWGEKLHWWEWKPPRRMLLGIFIAGFVASIFSVWRETKEKLVTATKQLDNLTKPNLEFRSTQSVSGDTASGLEIMLEGNVRNFGAPSAATEYQLQLKVGNFDSGRVSSAYIPDPYPIWVNGIKRAEFRKDMFLNEKTTHAIPKGDIVGGWLRFIVPGITSAQLHEGLPVSLAIFCKDINGKEYFSGTDKLPPIPGPTYSPATGSSPFVFVPERKSP